MAKALNKKEPFPCLPSQSGALFAVAKKRKAKAAALFVVSDILRVEGWSGFDKAEYQSTYPKMARLAAQF